MKITATALTLLLACIAAQGCDRRQSDGHSTTPPAEGAATEAPAEAPADQSVQPAQAPPAREPADGRPADGDGGG